MYVACICIVHIDMPKVHWQTIYCEKSTVQETGHFTGAMFRQHDTWIISTIIFEAHAESSRNLVAYSPQLCIRNWSDICVSCVVLDNEKANEPVYILKSLSWLGLCISIELFFIKNQTSAWAIFVAVFWYVWSLLPMRLNFP